MSKPMKRRIQPQLISPSSAAFVSAMSVPLTNGGEQSTQGLHDHRLSRAYPAQQNLPTAKEDSETAARLGMKGRRIFVVIDSESQEINFKKLLKAQGISSIAAQPSLDPAEAPLPGAPQRNIKASKPLAGVIARLERQYVVNSGDESSSQDQSDDGSLEQAEHSGDESGAERGDRENIGEYCMEDDFIDDDEFANFIEADRRKPKFDGFFINKGEIEKRDQEVPLKGDPQPTKKRLAKKTAGPASEALNGKGIAQPDTKKSKKRKPESSPGPAQEAKVSKSHAVGVEHLPINRPASDRTPSLAAMAALAGSKASKANEILPEAVRASEQPSQLLGAQQPALLQPSTSLEKQPSASLKQGDVSKYVPSPEMRESLAEMRSLAEAAKREESLNPSTVKSIPKSLNPALTTFACLLKRESAAHPSARDQNLYQVANVFHPLYTRSKLAKRLDSLVKGATEELIAAETKLKEHVQIRTDLQQKKEAEARDGLGGSQPVPQEYQWDRLSENTLLNYRNAHRKVYGTKGNDEAVLTSLMHLWPEGQMTLEQLVGALARAAIHPKAIAKAPRKSLGAAELPVPVVGQGSTSLSPNNQQPRPVPLPGNAENASPPASTAHQPAALALATADVAVATIASSGNALQEAPSLNATDDEGLLLTAHPQSLAPASAQGPGAETHPPQSTALVQPMSNDMILAIAHQLGANPQSVVESIADATTSRSHIITMVLLTAGDGGFTAQDVVDRANQLGLTAKDGGPWDKLMRRTAATIIRNSKYMVNIGGGRYAHVAFPGVSEKAAYEAEARKVKKDAAAAAAAAKALATAGTTNIADVDPEAVQP